MTLRGLAPHDAIAAGIAVVAGILVALALRRGLRWLGERAGRTRWNGDDVIVDALRTVAPCGAFIGGFAVAAGILPLKPWVGRTVNTVLLAAFILCVTLAVARVGSAMVRATAVARSGAASSATIFVNLTRIAVLALGLLVILQTFGISIAPLLTALGVGGLAVALALQDTLTNLFAGLHILGSNKVKTGDYIQLSTGEEGYVTDINWRNTVVRQFADNLLIIPNAQLSNAIITNFDRPVRQLSFLVQGGVGYDSDLDHVEKVTLEVAAEVLGEIPGGVRDFQPTMRFHTFGASSVDFSVNLRVGEFADQYRVKHEFIKRLHARYRIEDIEIPFPIRTVYLQHADEPSVPRQLAPAEPEDSRDRA